MFINSSNFQEVGATDFTPSFNSHYPRHQNCTKTFHRRNSVFINCIRVRVILISRQNCSTIILNFRHSWPTREDPTNLRETCQHKGQNGERLCVIVRSIYAQHGRVQSSNSFGILGSEEFGTFYSRRGILRDSVPAGFSDTAGPLRYKMVPVRKAVLPRTRQAHRRLKIC